MKPNIKNLREVKRLINGARFELNRFGAKISIVDLIALQTLKLYKPNIYTGLIASKKNLHNPSFGVIFPNAFQDDDFKRQSVLKHFREEDVELAVLAMAHLFPATDSFMKKMNYGEDPQIGWLQQRRVAVKEIFDLYTSGTESETLFIKEQAKHLFELQNNPEEFNYLLGTFSGTLLTQILDSLSSYRGKFSSDGMTKNVISVLNSVSRMEERDAGIFSFSAVTIARRAIVAMLSSLQDPLIFKKICEAIYAELVSIANSNIFVQTIESASHNSPEKIEFARDLQRRFQERVMEIPPEQLMEDSDFISIIYSVPKYIEFHRSNLKLIKKVFLESIGIGKSSALGSGEVRTFQSVSWPSLANIFGSEENAITMLEMLLEAQGLDLQERGRLEWIRNNRGRLFPSV